jgi:hypothetical protein
LRIGDHATEELALNAARLRRANDRVQLAADGMGLVGPVPFICECADTTCMDIVRLDTLRYENVRYHPRRFFTVPGHPAGLATDSAIVIDEFADYTLIDLIGRAGEVAEEQYDDDLT